MEVQNIDRQEPSSSDETEDLTRYEEQVPYSEDGDSEDALYIGELFSRNRIVGFYENEESIEEQPSFSEYSIEEIEECLSPYFRFFSREELDLIYMNFIGGKTQVDLTRLFNKTQPAICSDSSRIRREIGIIKNILGFSEEVLAFLMDENVRISKQYRSVLLAFFYSGSIIKTAQIIGINSMLCRARIEKAVESLGNMGYDRIYGYFQYILENLNKLKKDVSEELADKTPCRRDYASGYLSQEFSF